MEMRIKKYPGELLSMAEKKKNSLGEGCTDRLYCRYQLVGIQDQSIM